VSGSGRTIGRFLPSRRLPSGMTLDPVCSDRRPLGGPRTVRAFDSAFMRSIYSRPILALKRTSRFVRSPERAGEGERPAAGTDRTRRRAVGVKPASAGGSPNRVAAVTPLRALAFGREEGWHRGPHPVPLWAGFLLVRDLPQEHMAKHEPNPQEVPSAAALHASWTARGRVVASSSGRVSGAPLALRLLVLPL
jgi:hypothetical protein